MSTTPHAHQDEKVVKSPVASPAFPSPFQEASRTSSEPEPTQEPCPSVHLPIHNNDVHMDHLAPPLQEAVESVKDRRDAWSFGSHAEVDDCAFSLICPKYVSEFSSGAGTVWRFARPSLLSCGTYISESSFLQFGVLLGAAGCIEWAMRRPPEAKVSKQDGPSHSEQLPTASSSPPPKPATTVQHYPNIIQVEFPPGSGRFVLAVAPQQMPQRIDAFLPSAFPSFPPPTGFSVASPEELALQSQAVHTVAGDVASACSAAWATATTPVADAWNFFWRWKVARVDDRQAFALMDREIEGIAALCGTKSGAIFSGLFMAFKGTKYIAKKAVGKSGGNNKRGSHRPSTSTHTHMRPSFGQARFPWIPAGFGKKKGGGGRRR